MYLIQAYINGTRAYSVVVNTLEQVKQEVADGIYDGYQMYVEKKED